MEFQNSKNDYILRVASPFSWLWVILFGPFYWVYKGVYRHAILGVQQKILTINNKISAGNNIAGKMRLLAQTYPFG